MPYDKEVQAALELIEPAIERFRGAIAAAADKTETYLADAMAESRADRATGELGEFAAGRIDVDRFTALADSGDRVAHDDLELAVLRRTAEVLRQQLTLPRSAHLVDVPTGGRLNGAIALQFADLGRGFGAALVAELVRIGRYDNTEHPAMLYGLPRHRWHRGERAASPPLVVTLDGADLWAGEVAQYLDGNQKIILVVRPPAPPAALVRLITPATLVVQTSSVQTLASALKTDGPVIAALMPDGAAEFIHVPDAQRPMQERLVVTVKPTGARKALQSWSAWQQEQELQQLLTLSTPPAVAVSSGGNGVSPAAPADRLAAWLLSHADVGSAEM